MSLLPALPDIGDPWGPPREHVVFDKFKDIPYQPFSKGDKLGKIADWTSVEPGKSNAAGGERGERMRFGKYRDGYQAYGAGGASLFSYQHAEDESTFQMVDNKQQKSRMSRGLGSGPGGFMSGRLRGGRSDRGGMQGGPGGPGGSAFNRGSVVNGGPGAVGGFQRLGRQGDRRFGDRGGRKFGWRDYGERRIHREASVNISDDFKLVEEIDFGRLGKLNLEEPAAEDLESYGFIYSYDKAYDKISPQSAVPLRAVDLDSYNVTTTDDPILQSYASRNEGRVFVTDTILALLMTCTRSVYPWDIVVIREGDKLYFDKRENGPVDFVSVNENATDPPQETLEGKDSVNTAGNLSLEATYINANFPLQSVKRQPDDRIDFDHSHPFHDGNEESVAAKGYRYRKFMLRTQSEEEEIPLIVRTEVDAYQKTSNGDISYVLIRALNEFDSRAPGAGGAVDWRSKLTSSRGAVIATEMKNNSSKLARWAMQAQLAGVDTIKLGYVSRTHPRNARTHVVLGVGAYKPLDFAKNMNISISNSWGIISALIDRCLQCPEGKYVIVKDPNKRAINLYSVPLDTFEEPYTA